MVLTVSPSQIAAQAYRGVEKPAVQDVRQADDQRALDTVQRAGRTPERPVDRVDLSDAARRAEAAPQRAQDTQSARASQGTDDPSGPEEPSGGFGGQREAPLAGLAPPPPPGSSVNLVI